MIEVSDIATLRQWRAAQRAAGLRVALVPTMGYLHEGHLVLIDRARAAAGRVVASVFVNPTQFGPHEDFGRYPRDLARDRTALRGRGLDVLFAPDAAEMYPVAGPTLSIAPGPLAHHLCGPHRPGHFAGVLLVVLKLFHIVEPEVAVFGRKDAQQALLIAHMIREMHLPVELDVAPTVREPDGLAMSTRNSYLTPFERGVAVALPRALEAGHRAFRDGVTDPGRLVATVRAALDREPGVRVQYVELVDPDTLAPPDRAETDSLLAVAGHVGTTRLIDNLVLGRGLAGDVVAPV